MKIVIKSSEGPDVFEIGLTEGNCLELKLKRSSLQASTIVYFYTDNISLLTLFEDMSENWRGWNGNKTWRSVEDDLKLSFSMDSLGHVTVSLEMVDYNVLPFWEIKTALTFDAGDLEGLARQARAVLGTETPTKLSKQKKATEFKTN